MSNQKYSVNEVLNRYYGNDKNIILILKAAVVLCNRSIEFKKRFNEELNSHIKKLQNTIRFLHSLDIQGPSHEHKQNGIQELFIIAHDLNCIKNKINKRSYIPSFFEIAKTNQLLYIKDQEEAVDVDLSSDYKNVILQSETLFSEKDVLKLAASMILNEISKRDGIVGKKSDEAIMIVQECFNIKSLSLRNLTICGIQDDDTGSCLVAKLMYEKPNQYKSSKAILIRKNKMNVYDYDLLLKNYENNS